MKTIVSLRSMMACCVLSSAMLFSACKKSSDNQEQPTLSTLAAASVTRNGATLGGNVTSLGNQDIQVRGVVIATNSNPTLSDGLFSASGSGLGPYTVIVSTLTPNTVYHVRAVIQTTTATTYGNDVSFTTLP